MGIPNRERDFTDATIEDILTNLTGPTEESHEFRNFWANYGGCFDTVDFSQECAQIDEFISRNRYLMSVVAPAKLKEVSARIHELDEAFGRDIDQTSEELRAYGKKMEVLTEAISSKGFPVSFEKSNLEANLLKVTMTANPDKAVFLNNMRQQFGFDQEVAMMMWKIYQTLGGRYPHFTQEELDWKFSRVLSALSYPGNADDYTDAQKTMFNACAGDPYDNLTESSYFMAAFGISPQEYQRFRYQIRLQNYLTSPSNSRIYSDLSNKNKEKFKSAMEQAYGFVLSEEQFAKEWNRYVSAISGKTDFAHHYYIIASNLAVDLGLNYFPSEYIFGSEEGVKELTGWLGDATLPPYSFGSDDYRADLDAANISFFMKQTGQSYMQIANWYYNRIESGDINRAKTFLTHIPEAYVVQNIELRLGIPWTQMKALYPDTYYFIISLRQRQQEMVQAS